MKSLKQLKYFLRQNNLIVKADLKDTYFSILLHPETQKYVRFQWKVLMSLFWSETCSQDLYQTF